MGEDGAVKLVMVDKDSKHENDNEDDDEEIDETRMLIVDVNIDEDGVASIQKQSSVASSSRNSARARRTRRKRQVSLPIHDSFFRKREKQPSVDQSIDDFMARNGLQMPDVPIFVEEESGAKTDDS